MGSKKKKYLESSEQQQLTMTIIKRRYKEERRAKAHEEREKVGRVEEARGEGRMCVVATVGNVAVGWLWSVDLK